MATEETNHQLKLDKGLASFFARPGLDGNAGIQEALTKIARRGLEMLEMQVGLESTEVPTVGTGMFAKHPRFRGKLKNEQLLRINVHLAQWVEDSKEELISGFPQTLEKYKADYLVPTLERYKVVSGNDLEPCDVADYLVGSAIKILVNTLGEDRCHVTDYDSPQLPTTQLLRQQMDIIFDTPAVDFPRRST